MDDFLSIHFNYTVLNEELENEEDIEINNE